MRKAHTPLLAFVFLLGSALAATATENDIAISGYSPVSYFTQGRAERGSPRFSVLHEGKLYYLTSEEQMLRFRNNPEKYIPALGGHCPYSLALGRAVAIDPERFEIIDGRVYLFHDSDELDALEAFRNSADRGKILEKAEQQFELMRF